LPEERLFRQGSSLFPGVQCRKTGRHFFAREPLLPVFTHPDALARMPFNKLHPNAATPGRVLPSSSSSNAPPPVEMKLIMSL